MSIYLVFDLMAYQAFWIGHFYPCQLSISIVMLNTQRFVFENVSDAELCVDFRYLRRSHYRATYLHFEISHSERSRKRRRIFVHFKMRLQNKRRKEKVGIYWNYRNKMRYHSNSTEMCIVLIVASNYKLQTKRAEKEEKN